MGKRSQLTAETVSAVAAQNAGHPLTAERAEGYATVMDGILQQLETIRALPLKDVEPAVVFQPVEAARDD